MPSNRPFHFSTGTGGGFFGSSDSTEILASFCAGFGIRDDDDIFSRSLPQSTLPEERTVDDSGNRDSDGSSSPRREPDRSAIYQPSPELKQPSMRRSETMPVDLVDRRMRMRPGSLAPLTSSNPKDMKAPSDTSDSSSELHSETAEETCPPPGPNPLQRKPTSGICQDGAYAMERDTIRLRRKMSCRTSERPSMGPGGLFGEYGPHDKTEKTFRHSLKTSEDDKPHQHSPNDLPPHIEGASVRSDASSPKYEAASSRHPQGSSPSDKINDLIYQFKIEYEPQCPDFLDTPPLDANERKKPLRQTE